MVGTMLEQSDRPVPGHLTTDAVLVSAVGFQDPMATRLIAAALADLAERYGGPGDATPTAAAEFTPPVGGFFVATLDGVPAGCGGWRTLHGQPEVAEIKRMYTVPTCRGRGVARAVLTAIESAARVGGRRRAWLETGTRQPEAIGMYQRCGYRLIPNFGHYRDEPECRSFGRDL